MYSKPISRREFTRSFAGAVAAVSCGGVQASPQGASARSKPALTDIADLTITEASARIRASTLTATALVKACLERIEIYNPKLDAFITVLGDEAIRQAAQLDSEQKAGRVRGPLHGIPIALKDNIDTAGTRTTAASQVYDDRVPTEDAEVVRRLKASGAVLIGKANLDEFAAGVSYFGSVRNPWRLDRDPSGSSSGSAAAVAAALAFGALGTDTGGSVRAPAACCGVVGLKPTYGLVPLRGIVPLALTLDHCGPIARTTADCALLLNELAGYDKLDITSIEHSREDYVAALNQPISQLRVGVPRAPFFDHLDADTAKCVDTAIDVLAAITKETRAAMLPSTAEYITPMMDEVYAYHEELFANREDRYMLSLRRNLRGIRDDLNSKEGACSTKISSYIRRRWDLLLLRRTVDDMFSDFDVVVLPTRRTVPKKLSEVLEYRDDPKPRNPDELTWDNWDNCEAFNFLGLPAISIPCGFSREGLPVGLMIAGPRFSEGRILALAHAYELRSRWNDQRPPLKPDTPVPPVRS